MQIEEVFRGVNLARRSGPSVAVSGVAYDSRRVTSGSLFVAMQGGTTDGNRYIATAVERGAATVVTDSSAAFDQATHDYPHLDLMEIAHGRKALAGIAANFFG